MANNKHRQPQTNPTATPHRHELLRPFLDGEATLQQVAIDAGVSCRTVQRWLARYRSGGPAALARKVRADAMKRRLAAEVVALTEGLALSKPRLPVAVIHRRVRQAALDNGWWPPSYGSVYSIIRELDVDLLVLAHEGATAYRDRFELVFRHRAERPNDIWQADHTQLDIIVRHINGKHVRPWLTTVIDDHSRAVAGYSVFTGAPSALNTSLALRQAIWRKAQPSWPVCGIPDTLYIDHGSDFTSSHLEQAAADLRIRLVHSTVARPQGRGKVERLFGTINTELLTGLPGYVQNGKPTSPPTLSIPELDDAIGAFITGNYHARVHQEIGVTPLVAWRADGWLPRMPESLENLDTLLVMVAKPRVVHRDGIKFEGLRFVAPTLAAYVGEHVTIRFDPRDMGEIRVYHQNQFLCRAVNPDHADHNVTLKDIQAARSAQRRKLQATIRQKRNQAQDILQATHPEPALATTEVPASPPPPVRSRIRAYAEDD